MGPSWDPLSPYLPPGSPCPMLTPSGGNCPGPEEAAAVSPLCGWRWGPRCWCLCCLPVLPGLPRACGQTDMPALPGSTGLKHPGEVRGLPGLRAEHLCFRSPRAQTTPRASIWPTQPRSLPPPPGRHRTPLLSVRSSGERLQLRVTALLQQEEGLERRGKGLS